MDDSLSTRHVVSSALQLAGQGQLGSGGSGSGFLEVYPKGGSKQPKLLEQLQAELADALREAEKQAAPHTLGHRSSAAAAPLQLQVHRKVFDSFIQGFAAYQPLLSRIKAAYDGALDDSLRCAYENVRLRTELAAAAQTHAAAVRKARAEAASQDMEGRAQLNSKIGEAETRLHNAETQLKKAQAQAAKSRAEVEAAKAEVAALQQAQHDLQAALDAEMAWRQKPNAATIAVLPLCPYRDLTEDSDALQRGESLNTGAGAALAAELQTASVRGTETGVPMSMDGSVASGH